MCAAWEQSICDNDKQYFGETFKNELAELEKTIITSRADLFIREEQLRVFVNAMPGPAALFSTDGTILLANPAFAKYLHKRRNNVCLKASYSDRRETPYYVTTVE